MTTICRTCRRSEDEKGSGWAGRSWEDRGRARIAQGNANADCRRTGTPISQKFIENRRVFRGPAPGLAHHLRIPRPTGGRVATRALRRAPPSGFDPSPTMMRARVSTLAILALALLSFLALVAADAGTGAAVELADAMDADLELDALLDEAEAEASASARNLKSADAGAVEVVPETPDDDPSDESDAPASAAVEVVPDPDPEPEPARSPSAAAAAAAVEPVPDEPAAAAVPERKPNPSPNPRRRPPRHPRPRPPLVSSPQAPQVGARRSDARPVHVLQSRRARLQRRFTPRTATTTRTRRRSKRRARPEPNSRATPTPNTSTPRARTRATGSITCRSCSRMATRFSRGRVGLVHDGPGRREVDGEGSHEGSDRGVRAHGERGGGGWAVRHVLEGRLAFTGRNGSSRMPTAWPRDTRAPPSTRSCERRSVVDCEYAPRRPDAFARVHSPALPSKIVPTATRLGVHGASASDV